MSHVGSHTESAYAVTVPCQQGYERRPDLPPLALSAAQGSSVAQFLSYENIGAHFIARCVTTLQRRPCAGGVLMHMCRSETSCVCTALLVALC